MQNEDAVKNFFNAMELTKTFYFLVSPSLSKSV